MSPDPSGIGGTNRANPQTLNQYTYGINNPLRFVDPTGMTAEDASAAELERADPTSHCDTPDAGCNGGELVHENAENQTADKAQEQQNTQNQQSSGEGSQANLERRAKIADTALAHEGDTSMPYTADHATCNLFVQRTVAESGAPKPEVMKADGKMGAPSAAELSGDRVPPGWRVLKSGESPQPGDIAARKEHFVDATGHSGIVVSVKNGVVTVMAAHAKAIGKDMSFQPGSKQFQNSFLRYTGN